MADASEATATETKTEQDQPPQGKLLTADETAQWGNDVRLVSKEEQQNAKGDTQDDSNKGDEDTGDVSKPEAQAAPQAASVQPDSSAAGLLADPGEFKPNDYSFEVTTYDQEGKNPKSVKVKSVDDWDELLAKEPNFGSAAALLKAQRLATKMETSIERDEAEWKKAKADFDKQTKDNEARDQTTERMANEINYLVSKKQLPPVAKAYQDADWSDPEVAKQPGIKEQIELLTYMRDENLTRRKAGLAPMTSVLDAFNAWKLEQNDKDADAAKKNQAEARKAAGARVASGTPAPVTSAPKGIAVGRNLGGLSGLGQNW